MPETDIRMGLCLFAIGSEDRRNETTDIESIPSHRHFHATKASEKQTLKIEEVFTSSTRLSGKINL